MSATKVLGYKGVLSVLKRDNQLFQTQTFTHRYGIPDDAPELKRGDILSAGFCIRFDDQCRNGHNTFAITGQVHRFMEGNTSGACHEELVKVFPELAPFIKWHLCSSDGPMHYIPNTLYHASSRDHNGLLEGQVHHIRNGRTGNLVYRLEPENGEDMYDLRQMHDFEPDAELPEPPKLVWKPVTRVGQGKERDFDAARSSAVWPDATEEQLSLPKEELKQLLLDRHPSLMDEFKAAIQTLGFAWRP